MSDPVPHFKEAPLADGLNGFPLNLWSQSARRTKRNERIPRCFHRVRCTLLDLLGRGRWPRFRPSASGAVSKDRPSLSIGIISVSDECLDPARQFKLAEWETAKTLTIMITPFHLPKHSTLLASDLAHGCGVSCPQH